MRCGVCGADNNFCGACGAALVAVANGAAAGAPAGFWTRLAATLIDIFLLLAFGVISFQLLVTVTLALGQWTNAIPGGAAILREVEWFFSLYFVPPLVTSLFYFTLAVTVWGTTIGKRVAGLRVVAADGSEMSAGRSFARAAVLVVSIASGIGLIISGIMVAARDDKRGLNDVICGTMVVRR